jgi:F-type H+-transporting ATPase subunit delta
MTNKMSSSKIAKPYAEAFFQLGLNLYINEDNPDLFYKLVFDIQDLLKLLSEVPNLKDFLMNPLNSAQAKKQVLEKCFSQQISPNTGEKFLEKAYDFLCIKFVEVRSTIKLTSTQEKVLIEKINSMLGPIFTEPYVQFANIRLSLIIDETILGGLIIKIGSKVIDLSLQGELQRLRKELDIL